ncbi:hypothetical protein DL93DRAFT_2071769 [Clavulina sp. PMI_390]|nr:hypothetical protein DL93DRAFT_2071769 [Clavulina sp. PMI_390]
MSHDEGDDEYPQGGVPPSRRSSANSAWAPVSRRLRMSFKRARRSSSFAVDGPLSEGSSPTTPLFPGLADSANAGAAGSGISDYGTLPRVRSAFGLANGRYSSVPSSASINAPPRDSFVSNSNSLLRSFRRHKGYDRALQENVEDTNTYINGIRFYYSTFTSIDWLHDAVKDSTRVLSLRRRRSLRGRVVNLLDRSLGWIVVSIVGFLTAVLAFGIIRLEQWLFDIKGGYCTTGWYKAERFCCPRPRIDRNPLANMSLPVMALYPFNVSPLKSAGQDQHLVAASCEAWITWAEALDTSRTWPKSEEWMVEYGVYALFALAFAFISGVLTIYLTASTSFVSSTDSTSYIAASKEGGARPELPKRKVLYFAAGSGIPELKCILGGFVMRGYLGARTLFTKSVGLALSVASGLTLGKEGPFVHIASCIGNIVSRWFTKYETNEAKRREILSAACAAGVAVAFGAPVGGVLFSLEEVSYFFPAKVMWRSFFCAMIATATLRFLDPFGTGKLVLFQVTYDKDWHAFELWFFVLLGLLGGLYGGYSTIAHVWWVKNVRSIKWIQQHPLSEVVGITLLTTLLTFLNPYTKMGGTELVYNLFAECHEGDWHEGLCVSRNSPLMPVINTIAVAALIKAALVTITFGIKVPAGIFIPTLGVGACAGRIVGLLVQWLEHNRPELSMFDVCREVGEKNCVIPGLYAMIGAAAALSGVTRTTVSLAVIVFELTRSMNYVVPVMVSVLVAKTVADFIKPTPLYDCVSEMNQLPYLDCKHEYLWGSRTLADVVDSRVDVIRADRDSTVSMLRRKLEHAKEEDGGFPVVIKEDGLYKPIGYIGNNELDHALTIVDDDPTAVCRFQAAPHVISSVMTSSYSSLIDAGLERDMHDFTVYMDSAPVMVPLNSPLEFVHQMFTKLGTRYVIVNNLDGFLEGILDKKMWIAFVSEIPRA